MCRTILNIGEKGQVRIQMNTGGGETESREGELFRTGPTTFQFKKTGSDHVEYLDSVEFNNEEYHVSEWTDHDKEGYNISDGIWSYENEEQSTESVLELYSNLVSSGRAEHMEGHYPHTAERLVNSGVLKPSGKIVQKKVKKALAVA